MKRLSKPAARMLAGALALVMALVFAAPPAVAAEGVAEAPVPASDSAQAVKPTLAASVEATVNAADPAAALAQAEQANLDSGHKPFIKSPQGIAAVALLVAGTVLYAYSRKNDRPTSPVR